MQQFDFCQTICGHVTTKLLHPGDTLEHLHFPSDFWSVSGYKLHPTFQIISLLYFTCAYSILKRRKSIIYHTQVTANIASGVDAKIELE